MISTKKAKKVGIINEDKVRHLIIPFLSVGKRGFKSKVCLVKVFLLVLKRMKTGCQWRELSIKEYFLEGEVCWQTIYYYFQKWSMDGSFKLVWINLLRQHKKQLDLSSVQLDGSHTPCKRGGLAVGCQSIKFCQYFGVSTIPISQIVIIKYALICLVPGIGNPKSSSKIPMPVKSRCEKAIDSWRQITTPSVRV